MEITKTRIDKVGDAIRQGGGGRGYREAVATLDEWRESHGMLMDKYYDRCVELANRLDAKNVIVSQRLKRLPTIVGKLERFRDMKLSRMQDVAGVRIVVKDMAQFREFERYVKRWRGVRKVSNYIDKPKDGGYRGKHFVVEEDGMYVEIQLRTQLQHLWATTVETMDIFRGSSMKTDGDDTFWWEFFRQTSAVFAMVEGEKTVRCYEGLSLSEVCGELDKTMQANHVYRYIESVAVTNFAIMDEKKVSNAYYLVLDLDFRAKNSTVFRFKEDDYAVAAEKYRELEEKLKPGNSVVLVSVSDLKRIKDAYPNYFADLSKFLEVITFMLEKCKKRS